VSGTDEQMRMRVEAVAARRFGPQARLTRLDRLSGGASQELWAFDVEAPDGGHELILRRNPGGSVKRETAAGMETEARLIALAGETGTPAPQVVHVCDPQDGLGSGYVMTRVPGETLARRILRDDIYAPARQVLARQLGAAAAHIHQIDPARAGPLRQTTVEGSLEGAYALYKANGGGRPVVEWAFRWLQEHKPRSEAEPRVVHGDMRTGNVVVGPEGLRAVLDWEVVHLGDPMEDLAWICVPSWRFGEIGKPAGGVGSREDLWAGWEAVAGRPVDRDRAIWWEILGALRWGLSCAMMAREVREGEKSVEKAAIGRRASETEIDLLCYLAPPGGRRLV
jgi:aminoglycoside phosphotransferase (APT) family kinase protein